MYAKQRASLNGELIAQASESRFTLGKTSANLSFHHVLCRWLVASRLSKFGQLDQHNTLLSRQNFFKKLMYFYESIPSITCVCACIFLFLQPFECMCSRVRKVCDGQCRFQAYQYHSSLRTTILAMSWMDTQTHQQFTCVYVTTASRNVPCW